MKKRITLEQYFKGVSSKQGKENLRIGYAFEHKIFLKEQKNSIITIKSSGSRGLIDIISVKKNGTQHLTVKRNGYLTPKERKELQKLQKKLPKGNTIYVVSEYGKSKFKIGHIGCYISD